MRSEPIALEIQFQSNPRSLMVPRYRHARYHPAVGASRPRTLEEHNMSEFHDLTMDDIEGNAVDFADFKGSTCLIVNVASR